MLSLLFGVLLIIPIGGADMPTVIAILNSYAGLSAVAMGFVLDNKLLITAGALDGSSGLILAIIMCKAMNRSFTNVLFGAFGQVQQAKATGEQKVYKSETPEGAAQVLEQASLVVIIPGYGMAVAQAQHKVRELYDQLKKRGITVKFAIHPVAGRMPGHMNVLLAEADIPYTDLVEMDDINHDMPQCDVALVVGANDVVNPAARTDKTSPIYGMPIIDADKARTVFAIKRSKNPGFAGIDNELYFADRTWMLFGDAKAVIGELVKELAKGGGGKKKKGGAEVLLPFPSPLSLPSFHPAKGEDRKVVLWCFYSRLGGKKAGGGGRGRARAHSWDMAVAVVDTAGLLVYFEKMDDTQSGSVLIAQAKARSAALFKRPTKAFQDTLAAGGDGLRVLGLEGAVPVEGGVPLVVDGRIAGAIGVSGGTSAEDGVCAAAAVNALT